MCSVSTHNATQCDATEWSICANIDARAALTAAKITITPSPLGSIGLVVVLLLCIDVVIGSERILPAACAYYAASETPCRVECSTTYYRKVFAYLCSASNANGCALLGFL